MNWIKITDMVIIPQDTVVMTKIDNGEGERNIQPLKLRGGLWWMPDGSMYVYYSPTHYALIH